MAETPRSAYAQHERREGPPKTIMAASEIGIGHIARGIPNQDAYATHESEGQGDPTVILVSDGVGNAPRSEFGSAFAVKVALDAVRKFCKEPQGEDVRTIEEQARKVLVPAIILAWRRAVEEHIKTRPFSNEDVKRLSILNKQDKEEYYRTKLGHMYAATLILVAATDRYTIALQVGDGDVSFVREDGAAIVRPFYKDGQLGDDTIALSSKEVAAMTQVFIAGPGKGGMVMISTDGVEKSFPKKQGYEEFVKGTMGAIQAEGVEEIRKSLPEWLKDMAQGKGAGDDTTMALIRVGG